VDGSGAKKPKTAEQASKYDDYNRETKHRHVGANRIADAHTEDQALHTLEGGKEGRSLSPNSSRGSSISSEADSLSSDDSDVEKVSDLLIYYDLRK
jgi:hypothetical protein